MGRLVEDRFPDFEAWQKIGRIHNDIRSFKARLAELWPDMTVVEELTNGTKHLLKGTVETERIAGYGSGPYNVGPYGQPYLLIDYGSDRDPRYQTAEQLIDGAVSFWRGFSDSYFRHHNP